MANMQMTKTPMPEQEPNVRNANFKEVALGYTLEQAMNEAQRCIHCKNPACVSGCPVGIPIPDFLAKVAEGDIAAAYEILSNANALPAISGRVCPQENQCEGKCVRGVKGEPVSIGRVERFVADWAAEHGIANVATAPKNGHKVAVIGSGPAGLTCAGELARKGYEVSVFEAFHTPGGVLSYGIPEFRLPKAIVKREVANLEKMGVDIELNMVIGKVLTITELFEMGYEAVFIGSGAGLPMFMKIPGESLVGVYSANEYLTRINLMKAYKEDAATPILHNKKVAVVGGGNVAMDAARCAKRLGAEVHIVYRRSEAELPARAEEVHHAKEEGIIFDLLTNPISIEGDEKNHVQSITCVKMELGEPDASGRRRPVVIEGSEFKTEVDAVIMALGTQANKMSYSGTPGLEETRKGCVAADETGATSVPGIFAGGDAATGAATVILAMGAGKSAAKSIDEYIQSKK
ncbi:NADPH-dependent glutamate synthase [Pseudoflavonifractor phocaeensis]|uniref:NADPH-dependent glutamate synthase n=1 Tax=Pseudoflavonifractor phocaeensis TaxID=1870988 RepID=UPI001F229C2B|nr:NADPH-dependent glutamate synthase [Pseudoflavonifractor phocaeensis]MCF2596094.1 NADPH-dependent glutamate synthase [Pseudoflavonifractor phocaeensis]MDY3905447.1 NADPH-dependent glutamate synthase [Lawsonibacter sp.]